MNAQRRRRILVVEDDAGMQRILERTLARVGVDAVLCTTMAEGAEMLEETAIDGMILDIFLPDGDGLELLRNVRTIRPGMPLIVISRVADFGTKIEALRLGADAYLEKPIDWEVLSRKIDSLLDAADKGARVIVVEDDPISAMAMRGVLESVGHRVVVCADPLEFESLMIRFRPDLVVLDVALPEVSGLELARFLRQDTRFEATPVVYVTGTSDPDVAAAVMTAGAPVLIKPVSHQVLRATVRSILEQSRRLRDRMDRDALTGLLGRAAFIDHVRAAAAKFSRDPYRPHALAMIDLDHFKLVNDRFGHPAGDLVLRETATVLRRALRASDVVGRMGGEEFAVLLSDTDDATAVELLGRILDQFRAVQHPVASDECVTLSFSAGVAPATRDADEWIARADQALYRAKEQGRDRIVAYADGVEDEAENLFDPQTLSGLRQLGETSKMDIVRELVELYTVLAPQRIDLISVAAGRRDVDAVRTSAHALRGASGNLGVVRMHMVCTDLEMAARRAEWEAIDALTVRLQELYASLRPALENLLDEGADR